VYRTTPIGGARADGEITLSIKPGFMSEKAFAQVQKQVGELIGK
jgi:hypothetical protein